MIGKKSPWGTIDTSEALGGGAFQVTTPSHGGVYLPPDMEAEMPDCLKSQRHKDTGWYEEDCEWALVYMNFPCLNWHHGDKSLLGIVRSAAHATMKHYFEEEYVEFTS